MWEEVKLLYSKQYVQTFIGNLVLLTMDLIYSKFMRFYSNHQCKIFENQLEFILSNVSCNWRLLPENNPYQEFSSVQTYCYRRYSNENKSIH